MNINIMLLKLALALLIAAQGPNVAPELRQEAIMVANQAILYSTSAPGSSGLALPTGNAMPELTQNSSSTGVDFGAQVTSPSGSNSCLESMKTLKGGWGTCVSQSSGEGTGYSI